MTNMVRQALSMAPDCSRLAEPDADEGRHHVADGRERLEPAEGERPGAVGHDLGHQRDAHGELAADAQAGQEAVEGEVPEADREGAQAGEDRVEQDRQQHRLDAADPVAQDAEDEAADRPADHEDHRRRSRRTRRSSPAVAGSPGRRRRAAR